MGQSIISLEHATVRRAGRPILDDVSFSVREGEHVAVIGPNGAGKSTLLATITEEIHPVYRPETRRLLFGRDHWQVLELRKRMGIVSQSLQYLCNSSYEVREIVASGFFSSIGLDFHHTVTQAQEERIDESMLTFGISPLRGKRMNVLSSGEARRVLLARAYVHDPSVMLLDEGTANLDFPSRRLYRTSLERLDAEGKTIIMATHELSEIIRPIGRIAVMKDGKIVADGPKEKILNEKLLGEVYGTQVYLDRRDGLYSAWC